MNKTLEILRADLTIAEGALDIRHALASFSLALGYTYYQMAWFRQPSYSEGIIETPVMIGNIPAEWTGRYWHRRYHEDDCMVRGCLKSVLPVVWDAHPGEGFNHRQRRIAREAARYGMATGVSVPVRGPSALLIIITFARFREVAPAELLRLIDILTLGALMIAEAIVFKIINSYSSPAIPVLKPVECSCLLWAARGKSTAEIGRILGMPERTVYFHVANAMDALGGASRIQAVAEAMKANLIAP